MAYFLILIVAMLSPTAWSQPQGWTRTLSVGANVSLGSSDNVIGQSDGQTNTLGLLVDSQWSKLSAQDEWRSSLKIGESATRTPAIPRYAKVKDELKLESLVVHTLEATPWFGPYVKASAEMPLFKGEDVRGAPVTYEVRGGDGTVLVTENGTSLRLTDSFRPLTTKESIGGFFRIITRETMKLEGRMGLGAMQVQADDQRAVQDAAGTAPIDVVELASHEQLGIESALAWMGSIDQKTTYELSAEILYPLSASQKSYDDRELSELTNWELKAKLTSKLYDWLALDYSAKIFKQPLLLDRTQSQSLLLVNLTYQVF
jgi:hypothetical protein